MVPVRLESLLNNNAFSKNRASPAFPATIPGNRERWADFFYIWSLSKISDESEAVPFAPGRFYENSFSPGGRAVEVFGGK